MPLEYPKLLPQQRLDLEDWELLLSSMRTDANLQTKRFLAPVSYILQGFTISSGFVGQPTADLVIANSALINADSTTDFSWWVAPDAAAPITLPIGSGGLQAGRNFVEVRLLTEDGTPLQRAFWDPNANSGEGIEFNNEVDTRTAVCVEVVINQTGFNPGDADLIATHIIDLDGSSNIQGIQDQRSMYYRLGTPVDPQADFSWGSQTEPTTLFTFTVPAGTAFVAGESATFSSGAVATVVTGGTNLITVRYFNNINYNPGDTVTGGLSGAVGTILSYFGAQTGSDKDIKDQRDMNTALASEIKALKGTLTWPEIGAVVSLPTLLDYINSIMTPIAAGAKISWDGSALSFTDDATSGQATSDVIAAIRTLGDSGDLNLTRQDGTGGSASLAIPDGSVLFAILPTANTNRTYSESGPGDTNFQVIDKALFSPSDKNYWMALREGSKLIFRGSGELQTGEIKEIGDETSVGQLAFTGAESETDSTPPYTTLPSASLSNQFTTADSLTQSTSINAANINDIVAGLLQPYQEPLEVVSVAADDNEVSDPVTSGDTLTLPLDSRDSNNQKSYIVGAGMLWVFLNGQHLEVGEGFIELGVAGTFSTTIQIQQDLKLGEKIEFRITVPQFFGAGGLAQPFFVNYITGQAGAQVPVGALYNAGTNKLQVYRNGLLSILTGAVGNLIDRYTEPNNNAVLLAQNANTSEVFSFVNHIAPNPNVVLQTGITGVTLTIPTYTQGDDSLRIHRNGVLMSQEAGIPAVDQYTEATSTTVTLSLTAAVSDVFTIYIGNAPQWREDDTGVTGTTLTIPGAQTFVNGDNHLLVFRNGVLQLDSLTLGTATDRYQQNGTTQIDLEVASVVGDHWSFIYV